MHAGPPRSSAYSSQEQSDGWAANLSHPAFLGGVVAACLWGVQIHLASAPAAGATVAAGYLWCVDADRASALTVGAAAAAAYLGVYGWGPLST
jgi:hypothetical protein